MFRGQGGKAREEKEAWLLIRGGSLFQYLMSGERVYFRIQEWKENGGARGRGQ